ncbi:hypothetical protein [Chitinophaga sp. RAB17]|uniref:hypothetical protein n=1 Tax=Chitinophaga sp. RAB17 TaxID=3233049 RepID=UPI003F91A2F2
MIRSVTCSSRRNNVALYTSRDDNITVDRLTIYRFNVNGEKWQGLLGRIKNCILEDYKGTGALLQEKMAVTGMNVTIFDPSPAFRGVIGGL